jgi:TRAP-type mannitol/chloroaromatic compound transport system permease large subunit
MGALGAGAAGQLSLTVVNQALTSTTRLSAFVIFMS